MYMLIYVTQYLFRLHLGLNLFMSQVFVISLRLWHFQISNKSQSLKSLLLHILLEYKSLSIVQGAAVFLQY